MIPRAKKLFSDQRFLVAVFVLLISLTSIRVLPWASIQGYPFAIDFHNLHVFHNCIASGEPYSTPGVECGDDRGMVYPPLLYLSFAWTRGTPFVFDAILWSAFIVLGAVVAARVWLRGSSSGRVRLLEALMLVQFPMVFAVERGNNDVLVLITWSLAFWFWCHRRMALAGAFAGLAPMLKLYPVFALVVVGLGALAMAVKESRVRREVASFFLGAAAVSTIVLLALFNWHKAYVEIALPAFASLNTSALSFGHSLPSLFAFSSMWPKLMFFSLLGVWSVFAMKRFDQATAYVFAGALALSSYFSRTSYDYNLLTVYPLLWLLARDAFGERRSSAAFWLFVSGALFMFDLKFLWQNQLLNLPGYHAFPQVVWLVVVPFILFKLEKTRETSGKD
jgi:hypothetical protein